MPHHVPALFERQRQVQEQQAALETRHGERQSNRLAVADPLPGILYTHQRQLLGLVSVLLVNVKTVLQDCDCALTSWCRFARAPWSHLLVTGCCVTAQRS